MPTGKQVKKVGYGVLALSLIGLACAIFTKNQRIEREICKLSMGTGALAASILVLGQAFD